MCVMIDAVLVVVGKKIVLDDGNPDPHTCLVD